MSSLVERRKETVLIKLLPITNRNKKSLHLHVILPVLSNLLPYNVTSIEIKIKLTRLFYCTGSDLLGMSELVTVQISEIYLYNHKSKLIGFGYQDGGLKIKQIRSQTPVDLMHFHHIMCTCRTPLNSRLN